jgi:murein tripeptide amidase MpaA
MDFNRNYPHQWEPEGQQHGAGEFPFSEPETRAEAEFWHKNRNINGFISYHTFSAVILRPYSTHPDDHFATEDLEIFKLIGKKGTEITGYNCVSVYHDFRYHPKEVVYGAMDDYGYDHFGWYGFTIELWDAPTEAGVEKVDYIRWFRDYPTDDALKILRWNDEKLAGKGFIDWQPFAHPQLGAVEIGGWDFKLVWQNAPAQYLPDLCEKQFQFAVTHALMSPKLAIAALHLTPQGSDIYHLVVQIENQGFLPTYTSQQAIKRKAVRPIEVSLDLPDGVTLIGGRREQEIEHLEGRSNKAFDRIAEGNDYRQAIEWVIKGQSSEPIQLTICSERAGTVRQTIALDTTSPFC